MSSGGVLVEGKLETFIADDLSGRADHLAEHWLSGLRESHGPERLELQSDIAEIIRGLTAFMRRPSDPARTIVIDRLRRHADRRREHGYTIQRLLTDFELLSRIVFEAFVQAVDRSPHAANASDTAHLAGQLREALAEITSDAVGVYRELEVEQKRLLATKLAEFARTISHELKNPLGAAQSGTQILQDPDVVKTTADRERFLELVMRNLLRTHELIRDLRALALADTLDGTERWTSLADIVSKVFDELRPAAEKKGVRLEAASVPPDAKVDGPRMEIALMNLVGNAVKYADPEKTDRYVSVRAESVEPENGFAAGWRIDVSDNGLGIPRTTQASVFKRRFRAHPSAAEGTGLGLSITSQIVAGGGGRIAFESEEGVGTVFSVVVPAEGRRVGKRRNGKRSASLR